MNQSQKNSLNTTDWIKITNNFLIFISPIITIYLGSLSTLLSDSNHIFSVNDFIPNSIIFGMMIKQLIDTTLDIFRKYSAGN